jgi:hypothetical protein
VNDRTEWEAERERERESESESEREFSGEEAERGRAADGLSIGSFILRCAGLKKSRKRKDI